MRCWVRVDATEEAAELFGLTLRDQTAFAVVRFKDAPYLTLVDPNTVTIDGQPYVGWLSAKRPPTSPYQRVLVGGLFVVAWLFVLWRSLR